MAPQEEHRRTASQGNAVLDRECGGCTACCDGWLKIEIDGDAVELGKKCKFSIDKRCKIYETRPIDPCQKFRCGWLVKNSPLPDWMRPDKANVIFLANCFHWRGLPVDVAVPVANGIARRAIDWIRTFSVTRRRLLIYRIIDDWYAVGPPAFQAEMREKTSKGENIWSQ